MTIPKTTILRPLLGGMEFIVLAGSKKLQVFYTVIGFIMVNMMNVFFAIKFSANRLLHNKSMFINLFALTDSNQDISSVVNGLASFPHRVLVHSNSLANRFVIAPLTTIFLAIKSRLITLIASVTFAFGQIFIKRGKALSKAKGYFGMFVMTGTRVTTESNRPRFIIFTTPITVPFINPSHKDIIPCIY